MWAGTVASTQVDISVIVTLALAVVGAISTAFVVRGRKQDEQAEVQTRLLAAYREEAELEKGKRLELEAQVNLIQSGFLERLLIHVGEKVGAAVREEMRNERRS